MPDIVTRMDLRGWGVRVVALGAVVAVLAGCTGDPDPVVTPTPSPTPTETVIESPSPTPSPSPTELTEQEILEAIPEAAQTEDFWGAQEFTRFFLENYPQIIESQRPLFDAVAGEDCVFCARTSDFFDQATRRNHVVEGGEVTVIGGVPEGGRQEDGTWIVITEFDAAPLTEHDTYGELVSEDVGGPGVATVALVFTDHWTILEVAAEAK